MEVLSLKELAAWKPPDILFVIGNRLLPKQGRMIFFGPRKSWKSMLAMNLAFSLAQGEPFLGFDCLQQKVLLIQLELSKALYRERVMKYLTGHKLTASQVPGLDILSTYYLKLDRPAGSSFLDRTVGEHEPEILIVDPVYKVLSGDVVRSYDVLKLMDNLDMVIQRYKIGVILIHHARQSLVDSSGQEIDRGVEELMGSSYFGNWPDSIIKMRKIREGKKYDWVQLNFAALRHAEEPIAPMMVVCDRQTLGMEGTAISKLKEDASE